MSLAQLYQFILRTANLDGKIITDICRSFMKKFKMEKHNRRTKNATKIPLKDDISSKSMFFSI